MSKKKKTTTPSPTPTPATPSKRMLTIYGGIITAIFIFVWLIPITYVGGVGRDVSWMPTIMKHQMRVACLFTHKSSSWRSYHMQIQTEASGDEWVELDDAGYFDMTVFGYRSRLHRLLGQSWRKPKGIKRTQAISAWMKDQYAIKNPNGPKLTAIRYVLTSHSIQKLAKQDTRYKKEPLSSVDPKKWVIFGEVRFDGKPATHPTHGRSTRRKPAFNLPNRAITPRVPVQKIITDVPLAPNTPQIPAIPQTPATPQIPATPQTPNTPPPAQ